MPFGPPYQPLMLHASSYYLLALSLRVSKAYSVETQHQRATSLCMQCPRPKGFGCCDFYFGYVQLLHYARIVAQRSTCTAGEAKCRFDSRSLL